jgi:hypothetical protein
MDKNFCLKESLESIKHLLPKQFPIKDFVHHNTLHAFENLPFEAALLEASSIFDASAYLNLNKYRSIFESKKIDATFLEASIQETFSKSFLSGTYFHKNGLFLVHFFLKNYQEISDFKSFYANYVPKKMTTRELGKFFFKINQLLPKHVSKKKFPRMRLIKQKKIDLNKINRIFIKLLSHYLDQGISEWEFPSAEKGFYQGFLSLLENNIVSLAIFVQSEDLTILRTMNPEKAIYYYLDKLCSEDSEKKDYIQETLFAHIGWSGMVSVIEDQPHCLRKKRPISLMEILAVKLFLEYELMAHTTPSSEVALTVFSEKNRSFGSMVAHHKRKSHIASLTSLFMQLEIDMNIFSERSKKNISFLEQVSVLKLQEVFHKALEKAQYHSFLAQLQHNAKRNHDQRNPKTQPITAIFCIDDREASLRTYLEEDPMIQTQGVPGFFGIDFLFQSSQAPHPEKLCPVTVIPQHIVREIHEETSFFLKNLKNFFHAGMNSFLLGWIFLPLSAPWIFLKILMRMFLPTTYASFHKRSFVLKNSRLKFIREGDSETLPKKGYTFEEMAERVSELIKIVGMEKLSPLIVIMGHESSSINNPHFAAYDCGACSGRSGGANAKTFALMANHPQVRAMLPLPEDVFFIGALHNTAEDTLTFFDEKTIPPSHQTLFNTFKSSANRALIKNAKERSRRFELIPLNTSLKKAHEEVILRACSLFEPRPEYNHATHSFCIVGRRYLTHQFFTDRKAFLQSYHPETDKNHFILKNILNAVVPVCTGINLEYFFSTMDHEVYGSGTKLSHNVASLLGVMHGVNDDLRTGLPRQMVEIHDPLRCLFIIEKKPVQILELFQSFLFTHYFDHRWAFLAAIDPENASIHWYHQRQFLPLFLNNEKFEISKLDDFIKESREDLKFGLIQQEL